MSGDQVRKLVGGYATGTLTPEERQALFEAALEDQELFDALAREQSLRDLLSDSAARAQLLAVLGDAPTTWRQRAARWMWGHAVGLAAVACFLTVGGYVARQAIFMHPPESPATEQAAAEPAPPRRVFDPGSVKQPASAMPKLPAPPVVRQGPAVAVVLPPSVVPPPPPAQPAPRQNVMVAGSTDLDTGSNGTLHFEPTMDSISEVRVRAAIAGAGTLTGSIVDSSGAAVPGAQIEVKNLMTGAVRNTVSGPEGIFVLSSLEPARYSLTAKATGFKTYQSNDLAVASGAQLNLGKMPLALGALTEEIAVTAAATPVQTASSENSKLMDASQLADLTLKGRDLFGVLATMPQLPAARPVGGGKIDPALVALIRGGSRGGAAVAGGRPPASGGEVNVRITVTNASADSLAQLKKAGFTITRQAGTELTGRVALEKLETLAKLPFVVWIAPQ